VRQPAPRLDEIVTLRDGTPHTHAQPVLSECQKCHPFSVATHVDGVVELLP